jgi:hypothetical protein
MGPERLWCGCRDSEERVKIKILKMGIGLAALALFSASSRADSPDAGGPPVARVTPLAGSTPPSPPLQGTPGYFSKPPKGSPGPGRVASLSPADRQQLKQLSAQSHSDSLKIKDLLSPVGNDASKLSAADQQSLDALMSDLKALHQAMVAIIQKASAAAKP